MYNKINVCCQENVLSEAQAGKCTRTWYALTTDMFSEVTIGNHKCHISGFKEEIWQALLFSHVKF